MTFVINVKNTHFWVFVVHACERLAHGTNIHIPVVVKENICKVGNPAHHTKSIFFDKLA